MKTLLYKVFVVPLHALIAGVLAMGVVGAIPEALQWGWPNGFYMSVFWLAFVGTLYRLWRYGDN